MGNFNITGQNLNKPSTHSCLLLLKLSDIKVQASLSPLVPCVSKGPAVGAQCHVTPARLRPWPVSLSHVLLLSYNIHDLMTEGLKEQL